MGKYLLGDASVTVNSVDLSDHAFNIDTPSSKAQEDVSGFNPTGAREFLPGQMDQTITVQFLQDFAASKVHATLNPLFTSGTSFPIVIKPTSSAVSATNPSFSGTVSLYEYNGLSGALSARGEITAVFKPANGATLVWGTA